MTSMNSTLRLSNFWLRKRREPDLLRIVIWAQFNGKKIEDLSDEEVKQALEARWQTCHYDDN